MVKAALLSLIVFALCTAIIVLIAGTVLAALGALLYGLIVFVAAAVISGMTYYLYWLAPLRRVETLAIYRGELPRRALVLALEWAALHRNELREDWRLAKTGEVPHAIAPLE
jgi:hypothetical protein